MCTVNGFCVHHEHKLQKKFLPHLHPHKTTVVHKLLWHRLWITNMFCEFTPSYGTGRINWHYVLRMTVSPCQFAHCHYMTPCLVCTVIRVQLGLKGPFSFSQTINSHWYVTDFLIPFCEQLFNYGRKTHYAFFSAWHSNSSHHFWPYSL